VVVSDVVMSSSHTSKARQLSQLVVGISNALADLVMLPWVGSSPKKGGPWRQKSSGGDGVAQWSSAVIDGSEWSRVRGVLEVVDTGRFHVLRGWQREASMEEEGAR
jgi:hypothetical protein